jgi:hypothetical protein
LLKTSDMNHFGGFFINRIRTMRAKQWLAILAILLSAYGLTWVVMPDVVFNTKIPQENDSGQTTAATPERPSILDRSPFPAQTDSGGNRDRKGTAHEDPVIDDRPEQMTEAGVPIGEGIHPDPEDVENRILGEQLAESLRNPAYLQYSGEDPPPDEEFAGDRPAEEAIETEMAEATPEDDGESEPEDENALNAETSTDAPLSSHESTERPQMTPAGVLISEQEHTDPAEIEDRLMAEQLAESQRNPAYLQTEQSELPEEEDIE